jgi:beta-aspartyl-peptidase (threonine type)
MRASIAAFALAMLAACSSSAAAYRDQDQSDAMEAVLRTQESAWNHGDLDRFVAEGYLNSPSLTFFSGGDVSRGFDHLLERYRKRYQEDGREMGHLSFTDLETLLFGPSSGIVRGRWRLEFVKEPAIGGLFTLVMERTPDGWRIVHDHTSVAAAKAGS